MNTSKKSSKSSKASTIPRRLKSDVAIQAKRSRRVAEFDAPFASEILEQARRIAGGYRIIIRPSETLGYVASILELPLVFTDGKTQEQCLKNAMFGAETMIATMLEAGQAPPSSSSRRTEQINLRLTSEEKLILEEESQRKGFKGLSDYVRAAALAEVGTDLRK